MKLSELRRNWAAAGRPVDVEIRGVAGIEQAEPGQLTFLANRRYFPLLKTTRASASSSRGHLSTRDPSLTAAALRSAIPTSHLAHATRAFLPVPALCSGIHPTAVIGKASHRRNAHIGPYCSSTKTRKSAQRRLTAPSQLSRRAIGDDSSRMPTRWCASLAGWHRVILQNGVIMAETASASPNKKTALVQNAANRPRHLEDDGGVQANPAWIRATIGETRVARGAKLDDSSSSVTLARRRQQHALRQVGLAGSTKSARLYFRWPVREFRPLYRRRRHVVYGPGWTSGDLSRARSLEIPRWQPLWDEIHGRVNRLPDLQRRCAIWKREIERLKAYFSRRDRGREQFGGYLADEALQPAVHSSMPACSEEMCPRMIRPFLFLC